MKWFVVFLVTSANGHISAYVQDALPFDTPIQCEKAAAITRQRMARMPGSDYQMFCAGNHVVADFALGGN